MSYTAHPTSAYTENCGSFLNLFLKFINRNSSPHSNVINTIHPHSTIFLIYVCFLLACTYCDVTLRNLITAGDEKTASQDHRILVALSKFSLLKNAAAILNTRTNRDSLPGIHGIRFLSMAWIVLYHQHAAASLAVNVNNLRLTYVSTRGVFTWWDFWLVYRKRVAKCVCVICGKMESRILVKFGKYCFKIHSQTVWNK